MVSILISGSCFAYYPYEFELSCPYWYILFNRAGYADITYWYPSPLHDFGPHEMMTGDWAAAVSYSGLNETNTAEWWTDQFIIPTFSTNSAFDFTVPANQAFNAFNDSNNPVWTSQNQPSGYVAGSDTYCTGPYGDTGWSKIDNDKLEVTIHYEVVDLALDDPNNNTARSPLTFFDENGSYYVNSERYVILQTYVLKNIHATESITNLEFYQVLHGHPANAYSDLAGSYSTAAIADCLGNYTPYDPNHQTGNFHYDITM